MDGFKVEKTEFDLVSNCEKSSINHVSFQVENLDGIGCSYVDMAMIEMIWYKNMILTVWMQTLFSQISQLGVFEARSVIKKAKIDSPFTSLSRLVQKLISIRLFLRNQTFRGFTEIMSISSKIKFSLVFNLF